MSPNGYSKRGVEEKQAAWTELMTEGERHRDGLARVGLVGGGGQGA